MHHYESSSGKDLILEYIHSLTVDEQVDGFSVLQCLENGEVDKLKFYVIVDKCDVYILHCCRKQKNKTEKKDINIILRRVKELEKLLGKPLCK